LKIARKWLVKELLPGEKYVADGGYRDGGEYAETPTGLNNYGQAEKRLARARHETVNSRIKKFGVFTTKFRHATEKHGMCMYTVCNVIQIALQYTENTLFNIEYTGDEMD
jgi:hypothetical protein